jgi:hypothetical protein
MVRIDEIEVVVAAPTAAPATAGRPEPRGDVASRRYLRRL